MVKRLDRYEMEHYNRTELPVNFLKNVGLNIFDTLQNYEKCFRDEGDGLNFNLNTKKLRKEENIWRLKKGPNDKIKSRVSGWTYIPSITIERDNVRCNPKIDIFLLGPGEQTGYIRRNSKDVDIINPVSRKIDLEVLLPLGSFLGSKWVPFFVSLDQYTESREELSARDHNPGVTPIEINPFLGYAKENNTSRISNDNMQDKLANGYEGKFDPRLIITRGYFPGGDHFGKKSTLVNPFLGTYQMFALIGINTKNDKNKGLTRIMDYHGKSSWLMDKKNSFKESFK